MNFVWVILIGLSIGGLMSHLTYQSIAKKRLKPSSGIVIGLTILSLVAFAFSIFGVHQGSLTIAIATAIVILFG
jgi:hypothetical protein